MSSATSAVTYTSVYTDSEPGRAFWGADDEEVSEGGIPRVIVLGYDGLPIQPVAPPSPDYIPGPEDPQTPPVPQDEDEREPMFVQAHDPDYVSEPIYPEYIPLEDDHEFPAEEQPLPPIDSPTVESPGYVTESDPEEDPEEYEDDETEDGPVDYPMDGVDELVFPTQGKQSPTVIPHPPLMMLLLGLGLPSDLRLPYPFHRGRVTAALPPPPLPPLPPSLYTYHHTVESYLGRLFWGKIKGLSSLPARDAEERQKGIRDVGYRIRNSWVVQQRQETVWMVEEEAYASREAWAHSKRIESGAISSGSFRPIVIIVYAHETYLSTPERSLQLQSYFSFDTAVRQAELVSTAESSRGELETKGLKARDPDHHDASRMPTACFELGLEWFMIRTLGPEAYAMTWEVLKKKMMDKYYPQGEIKKLETELWNLKFVANETKKVDKYISGLPDNIYGNVKSARPKTLDETIELANDLMDQKLRHTLGGKAIGKQEEG
ncbi:hypothetical protein Tco_1310268 [Tanacetum coccineum]